MVDIINFGIALLTLIFYFSTIINKFKPCLNIILVSLFLISYSMDNTNYLLSTVVILLVFYFFMPNNLLEGFETDNMYYIIDDLKTINLTPKQVKKKQNEIVRIPITKDQLSKILENGEFKYKGEKNGKPITGEGIRIVKNITVPEKCKIWKVVKKNNKFIKIRMGKNQSDPDDNEEERILRDLQKMNASKKEDNALADSDDEEDEDNDNDKNKKKKDLEEGFKSKRNKLKNERKKKKKSKKKRKDYGFDQPFNADESFVNNKETLSDLYNSLDSDSAKGLNADTKELLETQKNLMNTIKQMGPVLSQGRDIMSTFDKYFGKTKGKR